MKDLSKFFVNFLITVVLLGSSRLLNAQSKPIITTISECTFSNGLKIAPCKIAYRTYGRLNPQKDNVVLIPTWLLGRSEDWGTNGLLGTNGIVDTTKYYTVIVDALGNGLSQSPSNTEASLKQGFDVLTIGDMVKSQYLLLTGSLGITHLHAVVGASMGGCRHLNGRCVIPVSWIASYRLSVHHTSELSITSCGTQCMALLVTGFTERYQKEIYGFSLHVWKRFFQKLLLL